MTIKNIYFLKLPYVFEVELTKLSASNICHFLYKSCKYGKDIHSFCNSILACRGLEPALEHCTKDKVHLTRCISHKTINVYVLPGKCASITSYG